MATAPAPAPLASPPGYTPIQAATAQGPRENIEAITGSAGSHADEGSGLANRGAVIGIVVAIAVVFIAAAIIVIWAARRSKSSSRPGGKYERDGPGNRLFDVENGASDFTQPNGSHMEMATTGWANEDNRGRGGVGMQMYSLPEENEDRGTPSSTGGPIQPNDWGSSPTRTDDARRQAMSTPTMASPFASASSQSLGQPASSRGPEVVNAAPSRLPKIPGRKKASGTRIVSDEFGG